VSLDDIVHPGLRKVLQGMYEMTDQGEVPSLDVLRERLDHPALAEWLIRLHDFGLLQADRSSWLEQVLLAFQRRRDLAEKQELHNQLQAVSDHEAGLELLRRLQKQ
jgi:hypothetical protein